MITRMFTASHNIFSVWVINDIIEIHVFLTKMHTYSAGKLSSDETIHNRLGYYYKRYCNTYGYFTTECAVITTLDLVLQLTQVL